MLVLSRKLKEKVRVLIPPSDQYQELVVSLQRLGSDTARLGFEAERRVQIARGELEQATSEDLDLEMSDSMDAALFGTE